MQMATKAISTQEKENLTGTDLKLDSCTTHNKTCSDDDEQPLDFSKPVKKEVGDGGAEDLTTSDANTSCSFSSKSSSVSPEPHNADLPRLLSSSPSSAKCSLPHKPIGKLSGGSSSGRQSSNSLKGYPDTAHNLPVNSLYNIPMQLASELAESDSDINLNVALSQAGIPEEFIQQYQKHIQNYLQSGSIDSSLDNSNTLPSPPSRQSSRPPSLHNGEGGRKERNSSSTVLSEEDNLSDGGAKKRTRTLPDEQKDEAYWERRRKNNEAAKRSRDARRAKEGEIASRAALLENENLKLRVEVAALRTDNTKLRSLLYTSRSTSSSNAAS